MLLLVGTVPSAQMPLYYGEAELDGDSIKIGDDRIASIQGTGVMLYTVLLLCEVMNVKNPRVLLAGDIGNGKGSRKIYKYLIERFDEVAPEIIVFHYILPIISPMKRIVQKAISANHTPLLIADAGGMYAAKASGTASHFTLFTPDQAELAFLADANASHPAYIKNHLFSAGFHEVPELIEKVYATGNFPQNILAKGKVDYIVSGGEIVAVVDKPNIPVMEGIGGTGDTITGMVSTFIDAGYETSKAAFLAAKINREAAERANVTVSTKIKEIAKLFPEIVKNLGQVASRL